MVDATRMSTRARAAISLADEGCHRSITATYTRRSVLGKDRQVTPEVLGVLVDHGDQFGHQSAEGAMTGELGRHHQQARIAARENLERPDFGPARPLPAHDFPQATALLRVQRPQPDDAEHLEERLGSRRPMARKRLVAEASRMICGSV